MLGQLQSPSERRLFVPSRDPSSQLPFPHQTFDSKTGAQKWARLIERDTDRGSSRDSSAVDWSTLRYVLWRYLAEVTRAVISYVHC